MIMLTFKMLGNGSASISDLGGPIMIGKIAGEAAETGWMPLFTLMALISVNLAFLNILPIKLMTLYIVTFYVKTS